jgi:hypothetical protein
MPSLSSVQPGAGAADWPSEPPRVGTYKFDGEARSGDRCDNACFSLKLGATNPQGVVAAEIDGPNGPLGMVSLTPDATGVFHGYATLPNGGSCTVTFESRGDHSRLQLDIQHGGGVNGPPPTEFKSLACQSPPRPWPIDPGSYDLPSKLDVQLPSRYGPGGLSTPIRPPQDVKATLAISPRQADGSQTATVNCPNLGFGPVVLKLGPSDKPPALVGSWSGPNGESVVGSVEPGHPPTFQLQVAPGNDEQHNWQMMRLKSDPPPICNPF